MANKIQLRRGLKSSMPTGSAGEPLYATDTRELFVGTGSGNVNMGGSHWYRGTAMSGTSSSSNAYSYSACPDVKLDDMYLNTTNGNVYACTTAGKGSAAKWTYQGCIKGATGATGATGTVYVDRVLKNTSENPVQNKTIEAEFRNVVRMMGALTNKKIVVWPETVNVDEYLLPPCLELKDRKQISVLCYRAKGLPDDAVCGTFEVDNVDCTDTCIPQSYKDLITGKSYYRDILGYFEEDGTYHMLDWFTDIEWVEC